jgi:transposase-like protein
MSSDPQTLQAAIVFFSDPENCVRYMVERRWPDGVVKCPTCGSENVSYVPSRRVWQCKTRHAKCQFSVKVGTIMEDSPIALDKWLMAMWMVANCRNGVSSHEIARDLGITQKSAWFMLHRIRLAMKVGPDAEKLGSSGGPIEVDETFIGPKPQKMHRNKRLAVQSGLKAGKKVSVMGLLERDTREVRAKVVPNVKRETLQNEILRQVERKATVYTDGWVGYDNLATREFIHETVNHMEEYVRGTVHTQGIENFWSLLKRSLGGTYIAVEPFHLDRYVDEQVFRYNNRRNVTDAQRLSKVAKQVLGRRLTYAELTGKNAVSARPF